MFSLKKLSNLFFLGFALLGVAVYAIAGSGDKPVATKVAFATSATSSPTPLLAETDRDANTFVFSAPPGDSYEIEINKYQPVAEHLSRATGKRFVYRYSDNWLSYSKNMASGAYDLVFDGAAFNGWRIDRIEHAPLVKLADDVVFMVVARTDARVAELKQLAGHRLCALPPPDVGALVILSQFDNPARQPVIVEAKTSSDAFKSMLDGKCTGSILSRKSLESQEPGAVKVLYQHRPMPNQAFSAGPRLSTETKNRVRDALLSPAGKRALSALRTAHGSDFIPASPGEYAGLGKLLKDSLYYY